MPRNEDPAEAKRPLERELRRVKERAGKSSRRMAEDAWDLHGVRVSHTALAAAVCQPTSWRVLKAFLDVCGVSHDEVGEIFRLWEADRRAGLADRPRPNGRSVAEYVASLRELNEWAGRRSWQRRPCMGCKLPTSTLGNALRPKRTVLPELRVVKFILAACLDDEEAITQWLDAWGKLDRSGRSFPRVRRSGGASGGGQRPPAAGLSPGKPARPVPPARCMAPGCGAPELIWDWKPSGRLLAGSGAKPGA
jgi:hypothetical protein